MTISCNCEILFRFVSNAELNLIKPNDDEMTLKLMFDYLLNHKRFDTIFNIT